MCDVQVILNHRLKEGHPSFHGSLGFAALQVSVGQGFALTSSHVTEKGNVFMRWCPGAPLTTLSDSHLNITGHSPSLPNHPPGAKPQASKMLGAPSPPVACLPVGRARVCPTLGEGSCPSFTAKPSVPWHHSHLRVSSVCLSLPPGKVSDEQAPHGPDAVLLTASASCPAGGTPGTAAGDGEFRGEQVPAGERA